eukprot:SAG11_NODE_10485_length_828_cov_1.049383_1_plen_231_part_10
MARMAATSALSDQAPACSVLNCCISSATTFTVDQLNAQLCEAAARADDEVLTATRIRQRVLLELSVVRLRRAAEALAGDASAGDAALSVLGAVKAAEAWLGVTAGSFPGRRDTLALRDVVPECEIVVRAPHDDGTGDIESVHVSGAAMRDASLDTQLALLREAAMPLCAAVAFAEYAHLDGSAGGMPGGMPDGMPSGMPIGMPEPQHGASRPRERRVANPSHTDSPWLLM